jgi:hypothetical protein
LSELELDRIEAIAERLGCSQRQAIALGTQMLAQKLGLPRAAAIELSERLARQYGDKAPVTAVLHHDKQDGYYVTLTVAGESVDGLEPRLSAFIGEISGSRQLHSLMIHLFDSETGITYGLGTFEQPSKGDRLSVRVADLPELVVNRDERNWVADARADAALRRLLDADDEEEP